MNDTVASAIKLIPTEKRALLASLLRKRAAELRFYPVSYAQTRLWFLDQLQPGESTYNIPISIPMEGYVDVEALRRCIAEIVRRHEALRTTIRVIERKPVQVVAPSLELHIPLIALAASPAESTETEASRMVFQESRRPFNLEKGPLIRATILKLDARRHILLVVMHHVVSDGWSIGVFMRELTALYAAFSLNQPSPLGELPIQYADYAEWHSEWLNGEVFRTQMDYWRAQLDGLKSPLQLPYDYPRPRVLTNRGATQAFELKADLLTALHALGQQEGATLFMTLLAALDVFLYRYSGETDFAVGSPIANRTRPEVEGLIGFFVNTIVLRTALSAELSFRQLLQHVLQTTLEAYENQDIPFEKLIEELKPVRDTSHTPLFQVMLTVHHAGEDAREQSETSNLQLPISNGTAKFDMTFVIVEAGNRAQGFLEYNTDLFSPDTIATMLQRLQMLLKSIVKTPDARLCELQLSSDKTPPRISQNRVKRYSIAASIPTRVTQHAVARPSATAFIAEDVRLSYAEFDHAVDRYASYLAAQGVQFGERVCVSMARGWKQAAAILATLKLGATCIPVDADEPTLRLNALLAQMPVKLMLNDESLETHAMGGDISTNGRKANQDEGDCVLLRSGTSGQPLAVTVSQSMLSRSKFISGVEINPSDRIARHAGFFRDTSLTELFGALYAGATVVEFPDAQTPLKFARALRRHEISVLFIACTRLKQLIHEFPWSLRTARLILLEPESLADIEDLRAAVSSDMLQRIFLTSSWSEVGGVAAMLPLAALPERAAALPIGSPVANVRLYLLDDALKATPPGIVGEIYLALDADSLDAYPSQSAAYMPDPFRKQAHAQMFRTGDLATRSMHGYLEFRGRRSHRIKIAGVRVEPAEVETALLKHDNVGNAVVVAYQSSGLSKLAAFVTTKTVAPLEPAELKDFLKTFLPLALIPQSIRVVDRLAVGKDGEIDRVGLSAVLEFGQSGRFAVAYVAPRNEKEQQMTDIWAQVLGAERIGIHDNFFALGGHSLLATQAIARINDHFGVDLGLLRLFEKSTIAELTESLEKERSNGMRQEMWAITPVSRELPLPLSFAQQRLWFLDQYEPDSAFYNIPSASRLRGALNIGALRDSINAIVVRHESLRTTFEIVNGQPSQRIHPSLIIDMPLHDLEALPAAQRETEAQRLTDQEAQRPFSLLRGPLIRAGVLKLNADEHILLLTIHHIVTDGWSMGILFRELGAIYSALSLGQQPVLADLAIQYGDFACWQRNWLSDSVLAPQRNYWKLKLNGAPPILQLPTDRPRPRIQAFQGGMHTFSLPLSLLMRLKTICETERVTLFMALLAGFKALLYRYTGQGDLVVGTPVANRSHPELEGLIGFFANTLVLRTVIAGEMNYRQVLEQVKETATGAYANQDMPFEQLVEELAPERNLSHNPLFQVMFALQNLGRVPVAASPADVQAAPSIGTGIAKFDLTAFLCETTNGIEVGFEYNSGLFDAETVVRMGQHFTTILSAAVDSPERPITSLPLLSELETLALEKWNLTAVRTPKISIEQMVATQAARTPDEIAVSCSDESAAKVLSYRELDRLANGWAHRLRSLGVGPNVCAGIYMERSIDMIVAILAVLKAGGAYVPLDPNYPAERLEYMVDDARLPVILSQTKLVQDLAWTKVRTLLFDAEDSPQPELHAPEADVAVERLAYVIYTSGSTGRPKGVGMQQEALVNLLHWQNRRSNLPVGAATLQFASLSFDVSFQEIFSTLSSGGRLELIDEYQRRDPYAVWDAIEKLCIQRIFMPYVALQQVAEAANRCPLECSLQEVITAGEQLKITSAIVRWAERVGFALYNQYGPTETHVVTEYKMDGLPSSWRDLPPIGKPIDNATIHILDRQHQPVPIGVPGELYIGGISLAMGYLHNPILTGERFILGLAAMNDERLYRSGDLARYQQDGTIDFLGRADTQLKIRGFRVEPEEIESALQRHPDVLACAVASSLDSAGGLRLMAYVQLQPDKQVVSPDLRQYLATWLPEHMVPSAITVIEAIPLTPSGKLDRAQLAGMGTVSVAQNVGYAPPQTPLEQTLVDIWQTLLQVDQLGLHDNFFDLGGHSLLATRLISRIREELDIDLPVRLIFEIPTIGQLAISILDEIAKKEQDIEKLLDEIENVEADEVQRLLEEGE